MKDDTLVLYYYNDGLSDRERKAVESAIHSDPDVAAQYDQLCRQLNELAEPETVSVPSHTVERWHDTIDHAARQSHVRETRSSQRLFNPFSFAWGAAIAAALVIGISLTMTRVDPGIEAPTSTSAAFTRGVQVHFRDTYGQLATLPIESAADRNALITQIIGQNRFLERVAEQNNSQDLARVLRAFEPILTRLAAEDTAPEDAEALRAKLAFELNVMLTKMSRDTSNDTDLANTGIQT